MSLNKSSILFAIQAYLYKEIRARLNHTYQEIHRTQQRLDGNAIGGFWFMGKKYGTNARGALATLHPALHEFMVNYLAQSEEINVENSYVSSYIQSVLNQCTEESQLYYHFPSGLHSILRDEGLDETPASNLGMVPAIDFNQKGKELLLARMMLNMTGA